MNTQSLHPTPPASLDPLDVCAGVDRAIQMGWSSPAQILAVELGLNEWRRGEEERGKKTMMQFAGMDLTNVYIVVAAARAAAAS